uniref:Uncharacterized protein n=1 Tax=Tanacetum cinerariifolium TaxID=118510 RepID=A0A6L2N8Y2_TANCI|nr:hypothetical protein [Tanacetum cinerariifolium]
MSASATQQITQVPKRIFKKQNLSAKRKGKHKSINGKEPEQAKQIRFGTIIRMVRGNTNKKRPHEQSEQWSSNEISFPSMSGCQLVDSPIILEALIEGFLEKLKESRTPLVGFSGKSKKFKGCGLHIHLMIKFPTANGIVTMTTKREILQEFRRMVEARGLAMEGRITIPRVQALESEGTTNKDREKSRG